MSAGDPNLESTLALMEKLLQRFATDENLQPCLAKSSKSPLDLLIKETLSDLRNDCVEYSNVFSYSGDDFGNTELWEFVTIQCYSLSRLCDELRDEQLTLVHQKRVRQCVSLTVTFGIVPNLIPSVAMQLKSVVNAEILTENLTNIQKYKRLCAIIKILVKCLQHPVVRGVVLHFLGYILAALCQLAYAPLKKPCSNESDGEVSQELYKMLCNEQAYYSNVLNVVINGIYQPQVIQELMMIQGGHRSQQPPLWLKKTCSQLLTHLLLAEGGVSAIIRSTMESVVDTGSDWKTINVLTKIITSPKNHYHNICSQLAKLVTDPNVSKSCHTVSIACINELLIKEPTITQNVIIDKILKPLTALSTKQLQANVQPDDVIVDEKELTFCIEHLHEYFTVKRSSSSSTCLPSYLLHPVLDILFSLYGKIKGSVSNVSSLVADLLFCIFSDCSSLLLTELIKSVIFKCYSDTILSPNNVLFALGPNGGIVAKEAGVVEKEVEYSAVEEAGDTLMYLLDNKDSDGKLSNTIFLILLEILSDFGIAPNSLEPSDKMLGTIEDAICEVVSRSERHVGAVRLLAALAEKAEVQRRLSRNPQCVARFLETLLQREINNIAANKGADYSDDQDILCVALMILQVVISGDRHKVSWDNLQSLIPLLDKIQRLADNAELRALAGHIYNSLVTKGVVEKSADISVGEQPRSKNCQDKSDCEAAFKDACDPLLPVRGHALVKLTELINARDREAIVKKDAILCLFQENLKNNDSFIYLAAINGMAAMTNFFPDTVLSCLTDEFTLAVSADACSPEEENLTRMKIGEVLVKVTRLLGDMASKYKTQLLNTFLVGARDVDPLVRASSLSNLGETCRLLGFRVGPVLQEILVCVGDVVASDKAIEPRRAAAMVITLLLQGLDKDALQVFPEEALWLLRALKRLFQQEKDEVIRLHVQMALAEMDSIARAFLGELNVSRKIVMS